MVTVSIEKPDLKPGAQRCVTIKNKKFSLVNIEGRYYCIDNVCTHAGGPLCEGKIDKFTVVCPWHGSAFDCRDGKVTTGPATEPIKTYSVKEKNGKLFIDI